MKQNALHLCSVVLSFRRSSDGNVPKFRFNARRKLATLLVALYVVCTLAPHAALAFSHGNTASHCLTETAVAAHSHTAVKAHARSHDGGIDHQHDTTQAKGDDEAAQAACCGLFFMTALATGVHPVAFHGTPAGKITAATQTSRADHPPGRLHRPPIL